MTRKPLVVFLDLDGTLVGDITPLIAQWDITKRFNPKNLKHAQASITTCLKYGFLRPHLLSFIDSLRNKEVPVEYFIYTASEKKWALYLVSCIEKAMDLKFNRPVLTRSDCIIRNKECYKSLTLAVSKIQKSMFSKYHQMVYINDCVLIDNNRVLLPEESLRWIKCPTYAFRSEYDVLRHVSEEQMIKYYREISQQLMVHHLYPYNKAPKTYEEFKFTYFKELLLTIKTDRYMLKIKDKYFQNLTNYLISNPLTNLGASTIRSINDSVKF